MRAAVLGAAIVLLLLPAARAQAPAATEYQLKAAYLYNFAKFVEWPGNSFDSSRPEIKICLLGGNPFGQDLENIIRDKTVNGRRFRVLQLRNPLQSRSCHILFISSSESAQIADFLRMVRGSSVLTVSDIPEFADQGGMINFVLENERVRFDVNAKASAEAGLKISSKVLSLARTVLE